MATHKSTYQDQHPDAVQGLAVSGESRAGAHSDKDAPGGGEGQTDRWTPSSGEVSVREVSDYGAKLGARRKTVEVKPDGLTPEEEDQVRRLQERDQEVRIHEQSHVASLGPYAGAVTYHYQMGPDGRLYAVGGQTEVRGGTAATPEARAERARRIRTAAMSVDEPSTADAAAATSAGQTEAEARAESGRQRFSAVA